MATAAKPLRAYREQAGLDADDGIALLMDSVASYRMTGSAADALCDDVDDEGMTEDFAGLLEENGLVIEAGDALGEDDDVE